MTQIARVMTINHLDHIAPDVVHAARQMLVIGAIVKLDRTSVSRTHGVL